MCKRVLLNILALFQHWLHYNLIGICQSPQSFIVTQLSFPPSGLSIVPFFRTRQIFSFSNFGTGSLFPKMCSQIPSRETEKLSLSLSLPACLSLSLSLSLSVSLSFFLSSFIRPSVHPSIFLSFFLFLVANISFKSS